MQLQPDIITSRITQLVRVESDRSASPHSSKSSSIAREEDSSPYSICAGCKTKSSRPEPTQSAWLRRKFRSALLRRAWYLEIYRSQQGWKTSLLTYDYVSPDSLVITYTTEGNVEALRGLFSRKEASPFTIYDKVYPTGHIDRKSLLDVCLIHTYACSHP